MKNVVLICSAGMSTSLLVKKMKEYALSKNIEVNINAYPMSEISNWGETADVILLGPQVRYNLDKTKKMFPQIPVDVIDMVDYGMINGEKVLMKAIKLIK